MSAGLPDWDQMSVREQCEVLKARLARLEVSGKFAPEWGTLIDSVKFHQLSRRVSDLESAQGRTHFEGDDCPGGHRIHVDGSGDYVGAFDVARWRRIEEAAKHLSDVDGELVRFVGSVAKYEHERKAMNALREALKP